MDEVDCGNPNVLCVLNAALANKKMLFPGQKKMIKCHKNFRVIACGNTWGNGKCGDYAGRNRLDAATLDRFVGIEVDVDEKMLKKLVDDKDVILLAKKLKNYSESDFKCSPREMIYCAKLHKAGMSLDDAAKITLLKGKDKDMQEMVLATINGMELPEIDVVEDCNI